MPGNCVLQALAFRHACKKFDPTRAIPPAVLRDIMQAAWLSPSSFGMEPWRFLVIGDAALRADLRPLCWDQPQITDASHLVVILARAGSLYADGEHVRRTLQMRGLRGEAAQAQLQRRRNYQMHEIAPRLSLFAWASKQCYIALANIMTAAAAAGVDSCPLEGFEKDKVDAWLARHLPRELPPDFSVAVMVALGYRHPQWRQPRRVRLPLEEVVRFL